MLDPGKLTKKNWRIWVDAVRANSADVPQSGRQFKDLSVNLGVIRTRY
jgi:hypothetical protein